MFSDVLVALRRARRIDAILVVSTDRGAQRIAGAYGARLLDDDDRGHNYAAARGIQTARSTRDSSARCWFPGDCPALDPAELDELLIAAGSSATLGADRARPPRHRHQRAAARPRRTRSSPRSGQGAASGTSTRPSRPGFDHEVVRRSHAGAGRRHPGRSRQLCGAFLAGRHGGAAHTRGMLRRLAASAQDDRARRAA